MAQGTLTRSEIVRRGEEIYKQKIRAQVEPQHKGKFLVVDVDTGDYEIDSDELAAFQRARSKRPDAQLYLLRIGYPTAYRLGGRFGTISP
jgi:hypothetical protein